jgi:hypothetical protein
MAYGFTRQAAVIAALVAAAATGGVPAQAATKYAVHRYTTEGTAQKHCPKDAVVYGTGHNGVYFLKDDPKYGHIKNAWYVCRREADHGGWHLQAH